ncbi:alpha/beta fold hydrolase [Roseomonas xinghualingensis]|uniref:alpha/beta fold hydrolase n=1 Tax=Roseomonas xinghualingensis TaxID=2986475 RepID=UPI0021F1BB30|nr:alpha/beta hydrolase [Roseomonas sp. SXEYE001]MCV4208754.1 alpha/beta hydrolase [Roseomonas sp. SXEYE001]
MADATAVVMLHGIGADARLWQPQRASFAARGYRAVPLNFPGYGERPPVDSMDFDGMAADVEAAIVEAGLERPVLLGHSMGGMVVQTMLRRRPDAYAAAILCATSPAFGNPSGEFQQKFVAARLKPLEDGLSLADIAEDTLAKLVGPRGADPAWRALAIEALAAASPRTFRAAVHCLVTFDERGNLGAIRIPTLCLAGEADTNAPAPMMERMAGKIPGAEYICLPGVGHMPQIEAPSEFDAAVLGFLDRHLTGKDR